jgi:hypothetical protein
VAIDLHQLPALDVIPPFAQLEYVKPYTEAALEQWRTVGDPLADTVVAELAAAGPLTNIFDLLGAVRARAERGDKKCEAFLRHTNDVPTWADFDAMLAGQRLIATYGPFMGLSLLSGSLVGGAVFQKMALVTAMTGMLSGSATQRLSETMAMVLRMAFPEEIRPGGKAHETLARVRLLHAGIRRHLLDTGRFSHPREVPINQQDLAITLALFGYVNIRSLAKLGIALRRTEIDGFILLWRYAGHVLGIAPELLPHSVEQQQAFFLSSCKHQAKPDKLSTQTKRVLDDVARTLTRRARPAYPTVQTFLHQVTRHLSGNDYVTGMQIEDRGAYWGLGACRSLGRGFSFARHFVPGGESALHDLGVREFSRVLRRQSKRKAPAYRVQENARALYAGRKSRG